MNTYIYTHTHSHTHTHTHTTCCVQQQKILCRRALSLCRVKILSQWHLAWFLFFLHFMSSVDSVWILALNLRLTCMARPLLWGPWYLWQNISDLSTDIICKILSPCHSCEPLFPCHWSSTWPSASCVCFCLCGLGKDHLLSSLWQEKWLPVWDPNTKCSIHGQQHDCYTMSCVPPLNTSHQSSMGCFR